MIFPKKYSKLLEEKAVKSCMRILNDADKFPISEFCEKYVLGQPHEKIKLQSDAMKILTDMLAIAFSDGGQAAIEIIEEWRKDENSTG